MDGLVVRKAYGSARWLSKMGWALGAFLLFFLMSTSSFAQSAPPPSSSPAPKKQRRPWLELSAMGSLSRSNYGSGSYSKNQRLTGSVGLYVTSTTEIEVSYTDARSLYNSEPAPKTITVTKERMLSLSVSQYLLPRTFFFQPYIKAGAGQLNRKQQVTYNGREQPETTFKQPSGVLGAGVKLNIFSFMSLKVELTTYLPNFRMREAKENYEWNAGVSILF